MQLVFSYDPKTRVAGPPCWYVEDGLCFECKQAKATLLLHWDSAGSLTHLCEECCAKLRLTLAKQNLAYTIAELSMLDIPDHSTSA